MGVVGRAVLGNRSADTKQDEKGDVNGSAPQVDGTATEPSGKEPGAGVGDETKTAVDQTELEGEVVAHAGLCLKCH